LTDFALVKSNIESDGHKMVTKWCSGQQNNLDETLRKALGNFPEGRQDRLDSLGERGKHGQADGVSIYPY
jgi:hypothetical protein